MHSRFHLASHAFAAGALAGLITTILLWIVGQVGIFILLGVPFAPPLTTSMIYTRVVWGGMWGLLFLLPVLPAWRWRMRGLLYGIVPSAAALLLFNPLKDGLGLFGLEMGLMWPVFVIAFNVLWGYLAGAWLDLSLAGTGSNKAGAGESAPDA